MGGLLYLKQAFNHSDDALLEHWVDKPYRQYFCGFQTKQHFPPIHSTSLTKWRNRVTHAYPHEKTKIDYAAVPLTATR